MRNHSSAPTHFPLIEPLEPRTLCSAAPIASAPMLDAAAAITLSRTRRPRGSRPILHTIPNGTYKTHLIIPGKPSQSFKLTVATAAGNKKKLTITNSSTGPFNFTLSLTSTSLVRTVKANGKTIDLHLQAYGTTSLTGSVTIHKNGNIILAGSFAASKS